MKKKLLLIIVPVLFMIGATVYMAIHLSQNSFQTFSRAGYILSNEMQSKNTTQSSGIKFYFNENTDYKDSYDNMVEFKDTNGEKVKVSDASFVHYTDQSISLLKKGVIFNLDEINQKVPKYYNLFEGTVLEYNQDQYSVDNLGKKLTFKYFIVRVSENKYLVVSPYLRLQLDSSTERVLNHSYVEITFMDDRVVRIENQEVSYQTIAKNAAIYFSEHLYLNLDNEYFYYDDDAKINLGQIVIDSSDNIDIAPLDEDYLEKEKDEGTSTNSESNSNGGNGNQTDTGNGFGNGLDGGNSFGNVGGSLNGEYGGLENDSSSDSSVEDEHYAIPTATVTDLTVTSNRLQADIRIVDDDSLIRGGALTTIINNHTGKVVYSMESEEGTYHIPVSVENLTPDTTYSLNTRITYEKNDTLYTMDVVSQLFVTESIGIHLEKDYYTSSELAFLVKIDDYSKVQSADVTLYSSTGEMVGTFSVSSLYAQTLEGQQVVFRELNPDTKYSVTITQIIYDDYAISDDYFVEMSAKTLKTKPVVGDVKFTIDKRKSLFTLQLNHTSDPNNGIENYRYEVYDARTLADGASPIAVFEKDKNVSIDLAVDEVTIHRAVPYVFRVVALFYDNEKYIEYSTGYSETMQMDGVEPPSISFTENEVTFERINGMIKIIDDASTVNLDKSITIVYTNSIGVTNSITTNTVDGVIPFSVNNLRANETYTISVYGSVNLQDGNPSVDQFHIGSVIVKTKATNPFNTSFEVEEDLAKSFSIQTRLLNDLENDNTLEASTLTGITFTLYEGTTTTGNVLKVVRSVDRDLREYYSELKTNYYDQSFTMDPAFFGLRNSDFSADYYTIAISNAYDYTDFQNNIPIHDNIITFKANGVIPDLPTDPDHAIDYTFIRNREADSEHYDKELDANTIVGVRIKAIYDNAQRYAKVIHYHVFDGDTEQELSDHSLTYEILESGDIEYVTFWFGKGSAYATVDTDLRRGHRYYFTYDISLDLNYDGEVDTQYPNRPNILLKSDILNIPKQEAKFVFYPSTSTTNSMTFQYKLDDVDQALYDNTLIATISEDTVSPTKEVSRVSVSPTSVYKKIDFSDLEEGYLSISAKQALLKNEDSILDKRYIYQYFEPVYSMPDLSYSVMLGVNRVIVSLNDYDQNLESIQRIAALKLTFQCENDKIVKDYVKLTKEHAVVDMNELRKFLGKSITVSVDAYYDIGITGFDTESKYYALQTIKNELGGGKYFSLTASSSLVDSNEARDSIYEKSMTDEGFSLKNMISNQMLVIPNTPDSAGISFNHEYILLKKLDEKKMTGDDSATFTFSQIIPGISLKDENDNDQIFPTISSVSFQAEINSARDVIQNSLVYVQLFTTDEQGLNLQEVKTVQFTLDQLDNIVEIDELLPNQNYALQFFADVSDGKGGYERKRLYDVDENTDQKTYYFKTLSSVTFSDMYAKYTAVEYDNKYIVFHYRVDRTMGYQKLRYHLSRHVVDDSGDRYEDVDVSIPDSEEFMEEMTLQVPCNPGSEFVFDSEYLLTITPVVSVNSNGSKKEIELENPGELHFTLNALRSPYVGISSSVSSSANISDKSALDFRVSVYDTDKVIVDGEYKIQVFDDEGNDVTPDVYRDVKNSIKAYNRLFTIDNLTIGETYVFKVVYSEDSKNDISSAEEVVKEYMTYALNPFEINIGEVKASANREVDNQIDLNFYHSNRLTDIDSIRYTIYSASDGSGQDGEMKFVPTLKQIDENNSFYQLTLDKFLPETGLYYIQIQFLKEGKVVADTTVSHTYVD